MGPARFFNSLPLPIHRLILKLDHGMKVAHFSCDIRHSFDQVAEKC